MSEDNTDRHFSTRRFKPHPLIEQARLAAQYYSKQKVNELQSKRDLYFKSMAQSRKQIRLESSLQQKCKKKKKVRKLLPTPVKHRPNTTTKKRQKACSNQESSEKEEEKQKQSLQNKEEVVQQLEIEKEIELQAIGRYEIRTIHESILEMQKTIDSYLSYHRTNRKKISVERSSFIKFLKTTRFANSYEEYLQYLYTYNKNLYRWEKDCLFCLQCSARQLQIRLEVTLQRMTQIAIPALLM